MDAAGVLCTDPQLPCRLLSFDGDRATATTVMEEAAPERRSIGRRDRHELTLHLIDAEHLGAGRVRLGEVHALTANSDRSGTDATACPHPGLQLQWIGTPHCSAGVVDEQAASDIEQSLSREQHTAAGLSCEEAGMDPGHCVGGIAADEHACAPEVSQQLRLQDTEISGGIGVDVESSFVIADEGALLHTDSQVRMGSFGIADIDTGSVIMISLDQHSAQSYTDPCRVNFVAERRINLDADSDVPIASDLAAFHVDPRLRAISGQ
jgi:hypothetical protein